MSPRVPSVPSTFIRLEDHPEPPTTVDQLVEGHLTVLAGAAGSGKTTLAEQLVRHVASGHQLGRFDMPDEALNVWAWFLEDIPYMAQDRSLRVASRGSLEEDRTGETTVRYFLDRGRGLPSLRAELEAAAAGEMPLPNMIIIDFLRLLIGPQPHGVSVTDWERDSLQRLRTIAAEYDCAIVVLTHTNKEGRVSGTAEIANNCDTLFLLEPDPDHPADRELASLTCKKMRLSKETDYALMKTDNGTWGFTDQVYVSETQSKGVARNILEVLRREGPKTLSDLCMHGDIPAERPTIKTALTRGRRRGWIRSRRGHWEIVPGDGDRNMRAPEAPDDCRGCGGHLAFDDGTGYHPTCDPGTPEQAPPAPVPEQRPAEPEPAAEQDAGEDAGEAEYFADDSRKFPAYRQLVDSVQRSRQHPLPRVPAAKRDGMPWTLVDPRMDGEPTARMFRREAPEGRLVAVLDRNGSYPSAMSSVPVAPNRLARTGPLGTDPEARGKPAGQAGIYQVTVPEWTDERIGHPLGRIVEHADGPVWITSSHLELLDRLAGQGIIPAVDVVDSWTGKRQTNLFEPFYKWARSVRTETAGTDDSGTAKLAIVKAIRSLHCSTPSPFWRPDWHAAVTSQASVRHWAVAYRAVQSGAELVGMENCDEVAFLVPADVDTPAEWVPAGYKLGAGYGEIKHKPDVLLPGPGRERVKVSSPLTAEQWNAKGGRRG